MSDTSEIGIGLNASGEEITIQLKLKRLRHQLNVPIKVVDNVNTPNLLKAAAVCLGGVVAGYLCCVKPYHRERVVSEMNRPDP